MEKNVFFKTMKEKASIIDLDLKDNQLEDFYKYMSLLIEWNNKINLTAITDPEEIIDKHFIDSITISQYIDSNSSLIDVGTGAGFPGIPLKIIRPDINITLLDSLNKRVVFLNEIIKELHLENIKAFHGRVEEFSRIKDNREKFDYATSRAVANMSTLVEYLIPLVKKEGKCICMKGSNIDEEFENSKNAIEILGGKVERKEEFLLPNTNYLRNIILIKKYRETPLKYPRKPGIPAKEPII